MRDPCPALQHRIPSRHHHQRAMHHHQCKQQQQARAPPPPELPKVPELPEALVVACILPRLPEAALACSGRVVCRAARTALAEHRRVPASAPCDELPRWALAQMQRLCTAGSSQQELAAARAAAGDVAGCSLLLELGGGDGGDREGLLRSCLYAAAKAGTNEVLEWAWRQPDCLRSAPEPCYSAALGGQLAALKFLRGASPPCPWSRSVCLQLARGTQMWSHGSRRRQTSGGHGRAGLGRCRGRRRRHSCRRAAGGAPIGLQAAGMRRPRCATRAHKLGQLLVT